MSQIFPKSFNLLAKLSLLLAGLGVTCLLIFATIYPETSYQTKVGKIVAQPIPFSHRHHVKGLGLNCQYCHFSVESSASAGMPSTQVCLSCHSQIWSASPVLAQVRDSFQNGTSIGWSRVHQLPDFVYFNHSAHLANGLSCVQCHGQVENMQRVYKTETQTMRWCVDCHAHRAPVEDRVRLQGCYTCHR